MLDNGAVWLYREPRGGSQERDFHHPILHQDNFGLLRVLSELGTAAQQKRVQHQLETMGLAIIPMFLPTKNLLLLLVFFLSSSLPFLCPKTFTQS